MTQLQFDQIKPGDEVFYIDVKTAKMSEKFTLGVKPLFIVDRHIVNRASHNLKSGDVYWTVKVKEGNKKYRVACFHDSHKEFWYLNKEEAKAEKIQMALNAIDTSVIFSQKLKDKKRIKILDRPNVSKLVEKFPERFV